MPPDAAAARERYRHHADGYDASCRRTQPLRRRAIDALRLRPGDTVLDAGSGTGMSFEWLQDGIGQSGRLVGVELSAEMMQLGRDKVARAGWSNVTLIEDTLEDAAIDCDFDAVLCFYTHDVMRSPQALEAIFARTKVGARVAVAGMKLFPWYLFGLNVYTLLKAHPYMTTFEGLQQPWSLLRRHVPDLELTATQFGMGYIAHGTHGPR